MEAQERKEIYEKMLKDFQADTGYVLQTGFCDWLARKYTMEDLRWNVRNYPELMAQKPDRGWHGGEYWWDVGTQTNGRDKRIDALKKAIKLVKKQL